MNEAIKVEVFLTKLVEKHELGEQARMAIRQQVVLHNAKIAEIEGRKIMPQMKKKLFELARRGLDRQVNLIVG